MQPLNRNTIALALAAMAAIIVACSSGSATGLKLPPPDTTPVLHDPTVLVRNHTSERAYFYWQSGTTIFGADTLAGFATKCESFSAAPDSAFWLLATDTVSGAWAKFQSNYFDPTTRPAWTADIASQTAIIMADTTAECTP